MNSLDMIMDMLKWDKPASVQEEGRKLAQDVKCINAFLQPMYPEYCKSTWENCAMVLSAKTDIELKPYLVDLMEWLQDMNWPGAFCILARLQKYSDEKSFSFYLDCCLKQAKALNDDVWEANLLSLCNQAN